MEPTKLIWEKGDTFYTIHQKIEQLVGFKVVNKENELKIFTIHSVSKIEEGAWNTWNKGTIPTWDFITEYGWDGWSWFHKLSVISTGIDNYKEDINFIIYEKNHPFIFYRKDLKP